MTPSVLQVYSVICIVLKQFPTGVLCILVQVESNRISSTANLISQKKYLSSYYSNSSHALSSLGRRDSGFSDQLLFFVFFSFLLSYYIYVPISLLPLHYPLIRYFIARYICYSQNLHWSGIGCLSLHLKNYPKLNGFKQKIIKSHNVCGSGV